MGLSQRIWFEKIEDYENERQLKSFEIIFKIRCKQIGKGLRIKNDLIISKSYEFFKIKISIIIGENWIRLWISFEF